MQCAVRVTDHSSILPDQLLTYDSSNIMHCGNCIWDFSDHPIICIMHSSKSFQKSKKMYF